jgi:hypothetical protein
VPTHEEILAGPSRPLGAPEIPQFYLPADSTPGTFIPRLYGAAKVHFSDRRRKVDERRRVAFLLPLQAGVKAVDWDTATATDVLPDALLKKPPADAKYLPLPASAMDVNVFTRWAKAFDRWIARTQRIDVPARPEQPDAARLGPKRGGVSVELVAIVWELSGEVGSQKSEARSQ